MASEAVTSDPEDSNRLDTLGFICNRMSRFQEARKHLEHALASQGINNPDILEHLGDTYSKLGDAAKAQTMWRNALKSVGLRRSSSGNRRSSNDSYRSSQPSQIDSSVLLVLWLKFSRMRDSSRPQSSPKRKARSRGICYWNGQVYEEGQTICSNHNLIRCVGTWQPADTC
jgi:tetratricopeptide (TPR) repeat protein